MPCFFAHLYLFETVYRQCCQVLRKLLRQLNENSPLFDQNTPLFQFFKKSPTFPLFIAFHCTLTFENYDEIVFYFNGFYLVSCTKCLKTKFRYFSATFSSHSGIVKNFDAALDPVASAPAPTLLYTVARQNF
jgi:hypothetical protein